MRLFLMSLTWLAISVFTVSWLSSCKRGGRVSQRIIQSKQALFSSDEAREAIMSAFPAVDSVKGRTTVSGAVAYVYAQADYEPIWVSEDGVTEDAQQLLKDLDSLKNDGINTERYKLQQLTAAFSRLKDEPSLKEAVAFDTACTRAYLQASHDLLLGVLVPRKADSLWYHSNDSNWNAPQLLVDMARNDQYTALAGFRSSISTYALLQKEYARCRLLDKDADLKQLKSLVSGRNSPDSIVIAIIRKEVPWAESVTRDDSLPRFSQLLRLYQEARGLKQTGKLDSNTVRALSSSPDSIALRIAANLERLRWLPQHLESQYVLVNVPLMELFLRRDGYTAMNMRVVVGRPSRQTPALNAKMANVVFSPSWGVPPTILKKDVLPGVNKSGVAYLRKKNLKVYDRKGRPVDPEIVNENNIRKFILKQPPGEDNALGDVKFNLPNRWDIYLHDTPHREDFPRPYRAKSSGCIRVERPRELAEYILKEMEGKERFDQYTIDSIIQTRKTKFESLKRDIPVHIVYLTAMENDANGQLRMIQDIYGRDSKLMALLAE